MPISLPDGWGPDDAPPEREQAPDKNDDGSKCEKCDAYKETLTDLGKIWIPVERGRR